MPVEKSAPIKGIVTVPPAPPVVTPIEFNANPVVAVAVMV
jgi:hypothetical protein